MTGNPAFAKAIALFFIAKFSKVELSARLDTEEFLCICPRFALLEKFLKLP